MDWISDIVKHITLSRPLTIALLITSTVLLIGPKSKYFPSNIEAVPAGWNWAVLAVFVFTASLTIFWLLEAIGKLLYSGLHSIKNALLIPTSKENAILYALAQHPSQTSNLEELHHMNQGKISKLQLLDLSKSLCKKGYIAENFMDKNLVYLTEKGERYALKLETIVHAQQSKSEA
jgi:DNA-binding MarR family transcriptional regulator